MHVAASNGLIRDQVFFAFRVSDIADKISLKFSIASKYLYFNYPPVFYKIYLNEVIERK